MPSTATSTRVFLEAVEDAGTRHLVFMLDGTPLVAPGYHVTEIKALTYDAMDCGGQAAQWRETIVQLWVPEEREEGGFMSARKFLAIYQRVASNIRIDDEAEIRFEYGDLNRPAVSYHVGRLERHDDTLLVHLRSPSVTCKARDRRIPAEGACCTPGAEEAQPIPEGALLEHSRTEPQGCC